MSTDTLVVEPAVGGSTTTTAGLVAVEAGVDAAEAFARGDWVEGSVVGLSAGLDVLGAVLDPIGTAGACVAGWLMEHLGPVQEWLDQLCGDPAVIGAASATWLRVAAHLDATAEGYRGAVAGDLADHEGLTARAYREYATVEAGIVAALGRVAAGVGGGVAAAGALLAGVRDLISWLVAELVGEVVSRVGETLLTGGIAAPHALAAAAAKCREVIANVRRFMDDLARSLDRLAQLLGVVSPALERGAATLATAARRAGAVTSRELQLGLLGAAPFAGLDDDPAYASA